MKTMSVFLILCMLSGCSTSIYVNDINFETVRNQINQEALGKKPYVTDVNNNTTLAYSLNLDADSVRFISKGFQKMSYPVESLKKISFTDNAQGARDGALVGFAAGSVYGILKAASYGGSGENFIAYLLVGAIYGLPNSALGLIGGFVVGSRKEFVFGDKHLENKRPLLQNKEEDENKSK